MPKQVNQSTCQQCGIAILSLARCIGCIKRRGGVSVRSFMFAVTARLALRLFLFVFARFVELTFPRRENSNVEVSRQGGINGSQLAVRHTIAKGIFKQSHQLFLCLIHRGQLFLR